MTGLYRLRNKLIGRTLLVPLAVYSMSVPLVNGFLEVEQSNDSFDPKSRGNAAEAQTATPVQWRSH
jgi:hypothetical protein